MVLIHASRDISAPLDSVWDGIADIDREPEFWHGTKSIKNISKTGNIIEREKAIDFYKDAFGAKKLSVVTLPDGKILHARMKIGDSILMLSDEFPENTASPTSIGSSTVTMHVYSKNVDKLWERAVEAGVKIVMPINNQFWGERYGQLLDPFGHSWSLSMQVRMSRTEREAKRKVAMEMFTQGKHLRKSD
jgi:PhnB protein